MTTKISQQELQEFWEKHCGLQFYYPPDLDLNNLFKYAVPKAVARDNYTVVIRIGKYQTWVHIVAHYAHLKSYYANHNDPAEALFRACQKAFEGGRK